MPLPDCLTPPKGMWGSLPKVPALTTATPAWTRRVNSSARCRLRVWMQAVSP